MSHSDSMNIGDPNSSPLAGPKYLCEVCQKEFYNKIDYQLHDCHSYIPQFVSKSKTPEKDPLGLDPHAPGAKLDAGKPKVGLMLSGFARALLKVAEVTTYGASEYTPNGWLEVPDGISRYDDAKARHLLKGYIEELDPDSNISHQAHEAWNALAKLELMLREKETI